MTTEQWPPSTFTVWLRYTARHTDDLAGDLLRDLLRDKFVRDFAYKRDFMNFLRSRLACREAIEAAPVVWSRFREWKKHR